MQGGLCTTSYSATKIGFCRPTAFDFRTTSRQGLEFSWINVFGLQLQFPACHLELNSLYGMAVAGGLHKYSRLKTMEADRNTAS